MRNAQDAKDVVQSAYEKMWKKKDNVNAESGRSYLFSVAYHEMIDQIRLRKKKFILEEEKVYIKDNDHKKQLALALSRLTDMQRSLILLKDWEGYSYEQIAVITGLNEIRVKVYLHRARLRVRNYLGSLDNVLQHA